MGLEFAVNKAMATISVTLTELSVIAAAIQDHINDRVFLDSSSQLIARLSYSYNVEIENFRLLQVIDSETSFNDQFELLHLHFKSNFLKEAEKSRPIIESAYTQYQQLKGIKV